MNQPNPAAQVEIDLSLCDREPIHIPSSIQPHGVLLAARASDLQILYVSANTTELLGHTPAHLLRQNLADILGPPAIAAIEDSLRGEQYLPTNILTHVLPNGDSFDIQVHRTNNILSVELEPALEPRRWDQLAGQIQSGLQELRHKTTQKTLWDLAAQQVRSLTGYDRVMVYKFDPAGNGEVVAEARLPGLNPYLGLHYPATDIPTQARKLYLLQRLRMIADVRYTPIPILAHPTLAPHAPLDMTYCGLRSVSPVHLEYLSNMDVGASLAMSLIHKGALWGMIVCHHRTPKRLVPEVRALSDLLAQILSLLIESTHQAEEYAERLLRQELLTRLSKVIEEQDTVTASLHPHAAKLLALVNADGVFLRLGGQMWVMGRAPSVQDSSAILSAMRADLVEGIASTHNLSERYPAFAHLAQVAGGAVLVQILNEPQSGILWFRGELARTIHWGGNPQEAHLSVSADGQRISPRKSFALWEQIQRGQSIPWTATDLDMARDMQRLITSTLLHSVEAKLAQLSYYDTLTSLPNRRMLIEQLELWRSQPAQPSGPHPAQQTGPKPAVLLFLDIDNFKSVNDSLGHAIGDDLLRQIAHRLKLCAGASNLVARLGGDEFVVFCQNTSIAAAEQIAAAILLSFTRPFNLDGKPFRTSASVGIAPMPTGTGLEGPSEPLRAADEAMYSAKKLGGNRAIVFEAPQHERALRRLSLEQGLFLALERQELRLEYQAQLACSTGELIGFEALLRWEHPVYGRIAPMEFIPLAEKSGQIVPIGAWVLQSALDQLRRWRDRFSHALTISINVSSQQVSRLDFSQSIDSALQLAQVPGSTLRLEVTESIFMQDTAAHQLQLARSLGSLISVDDFGTGYSALAYLQRLPIDEIKIDKSMLVGVTNDPRKLALLKSIVQLAHNLELTVIAEGVETNQQWECLQKLDCNSAQGYFLSLPLTSSVIEDKMQALGPRHAFHPGN